MNDDLQKQLAELLKQLMAVASDAGKWAASQVPPLVQEKIVFGRVTLTVQLLAAIVALAISVRVFRHAWAINQEAVKTKEIYDLWPETRGAGVCMLSAASAIVFALMSATTFESAAMVWFAPRLYIVEWLTNLVKK